MKIVLTLGMSRPALDDRRRHQDVGLAADEREHRPLERLAAHLAVARSAIRASGTIAWIRSAIALDVVDAVVDEVDLAVAVQLAVDGALDRLGVEPE